MSITIRKAKIGDEKILVSIQTESWKSAFADIISADDMEKCTDIAKVEAMYTNVLKSGYAEKERHYSNHGNDSKHSIPHDHNVNWNDNYPNLSSPIIYGGKIPEFKKYGDVKMSNVNFIEPSPFESIEDFKISIIYGGEIVFIWKDKSYGVFRDIDNGINKFYIGESYKDDEITYLDTIDELLNFKIQGEPLQEIITKVQVEWRNL